MTEAERYDTERASENSRSVGTAYRAVLQEPGGVRMNLYKLMGWAAAFILGSAIWAGVIVLGVWWVR